MKTMTSFFNYTANAVPLHFGVRLDRESFELTAMLFMFRMVRGELGYTHKTGAAENKAIAAATVGEIAPRLEAFRLYAEDFFGRHPFYTPDSNALALAVICGRFLNNANEGIKGGDENADIVFRDDGFDDNLLTRANAMYDDSCDFFDLEIPADQRKKISLETSFLVQLQALEKFTAMDTDADLFENRERRRQLRQISKYLIPMVRDITAPETALGRDVCGFADHLAGRIKQVLYPMLLSAPPARPRPDLKLVPTGPAP